MSTDHPQPDLPANEELVAYLDGELPPEACRRIEAQLATDTTLRRQLHELQAAWDALDSLPQPTVDDGFARTTIEMVAVAAERDAGSQAVAALRARRRWLLLVVAAGIGMAAVGFAALRTLAPDGNQFLLDNLPVITQVDALGQFKDVDFLRRLGERIPLDDLAEDQASLDRELEQWQATDSPSWDVRRQWVEGLSPDEKAELAAESQRFRALSPAPAEQQRLRALEQEISQAADAAQLQRTALAYGQWLARRPPGEQAELRGLPPDERLGRIDQLVRQQDRRAAMQLSADDAEVLRKAALAVAAERRPQIEQIIGQRRRRDADAPPRRFGPRWIALGAIYHDLRDDQLRDAMRDRLTSGLSPSARQHLQSRHDWEEQLMRWVADSLRPKRGPEELEQFFAEKLDNDQREQLLSLPGADMQSKLERLYGVYLAQQLGLGDADWWGGAGDRGPFGPPPRGLEGRPRDRGHREGPPPPAGGPPPPRGELDRRPLGPGDAPPNRPRPDRQGPPDRQPPPDHRPPPDHLAPPPDHAQEPI